MLTRRKVTRRVLPPVYVRTLRDRFRHNRGNRHGSNNLPALALQPGLRKPHENRSRRRRSNHFHDLHPCCDLARDRAALCIAAAGIILSRSRRHVQHVHRKYKRIELTISKRRLRPWPQACQVIWCLASGCSSHSRGTLKLYRLVAQKQHR